MIIQLTITISDQLSVEERCLVLRIYARIYITGPQQIDLEREYWPYDIYKMRISINSRNGRGIIKKYGLEPFFTGYIQPPCIDDPIEPPDLRWNLEGEYDDLKASIGVVRATEYRQHLQGIREYAERTPLESRYVTLGG